MSAKPVAPATKRRPLGAFLFRVFAWLPVAFAVWYLAAPVLMWPVVLVVRAFALAAPGSLVRDFERAGAVLVFVTTLGAGSASGRDTEVTVDVDMLLYAFGLPLFAALTLAAREPGTLRRLAVGYVALVPFIAFGIVAEFLKSVAITGGAALAAQTGIFGWQRELVAVAYQFGALIFPATTPVIVWVLLHRAFLERLRAST